MSLKSRNIIVICSILFTAVIGGRILLNNYFQSGLKVSHLKSSFGFGIDKSSENKQNSLESPSLVTSSLPSVHSDLKGEKKRASAFSSERILNPEQVSEVLSQSSVSVAPTLKQFFELKRNWLRNEFELAAYQELLSDTAQIRAVGDFLLQGSRESLDASDETLRYAAVEFLNESLHYDQNPSRYESQNTVKQIILAQNIQANMPRDLKVSLAGDKVELSMQYALSFPESRRELLEQANETNKKIVKRAIDYVGNPQ